jgi:sugar-specific transcriptional regulator TrmB
MKDITPILQSLGLLDSEIKTYLKALELGPSAAADLAKAAKLSRQAVYVAIESLTRRGLMSSVLRGKKRLYVSESPQKLLAYAKRRDSEMRERVRDLERLLPELELQSGGERPAVRMFEGKEGLRAIMSDVEESRPKTTIELADLEARNVILSPDDLKPFRNQLDRIGTKVRGLYAGAPESLRKSTNAVFLPKELSGFKSDITLYGDKVALISFGGKMHSIIIESPLIVNAFKVLFDLAFRGTK